MQNENSMEKHVTCSDFVSFSKIVFDMIAFHSPCLVISVNLAFTHTITIYIYIYVRSNADEMASVV